MSNIFSGNEGDAPPVLHIHIIHVLRQRMLVKPPINTRYPVRQYVVLVALIPLQYVALLLTKFARSLENGSAASSATELDREVDVFPVLHVDFVYVLWQRISIMAPRNA
jgi:hypothetical protein